MYLLIQESHSKNLSQKYTGEKNWNGICSSPGFLDGLMGKESACNARDTRDSSSILGLGRSPGGRNATYPSILASKIPWTEELGGLQSMRLQRIGHEWAHGTLISNFCCRKKDPFQYPRVGPCLIFGNELSEETHMLTKQETLLGRGAQVEISRIGEPRRTVLPLGSQPQVLCW